MVSRRSRILLTLLNMTSQVLYICIISKLGAESGEHFVAYTYPGRLPGDAWGFSKKANLTFSMNWVGPTPTKVGIARGFINRYLPILLCA